LLFHDAGGIKICYDRTCGKVLPGKSDYNISDFLNFRKLILFIFI
jgi:hypothetical protein